MTPIADMVARLIAAGCQADVAAAVVAEAFAAGVVTTKPMGWERTRLFVLCRDRGLCGYCGGTAAEVDHIRPRVRDGSNHPANLVAACRSCNASKGARCR